MATTARRTVLAATAAALALLLTGLAELAEAKGRHGGGPGYRGPHHGASHWHGHRAGHRHPGRWRSGVSIGIGIGGFGHLPYGYGAPWWGYPAYPVHPGYGIVLPPRTIYRDAPRAEPETQPLAKGPPDPIYDPRKGQSAARTEADLHECNRWALSQPDAAARADVFHRATLACMEGRDYTVR